MNKYFTEVTGWPNDGKEWQPKDSYPFCHADIAVVTGTYNRAHLLLRSLFHYQACERPTWKYEPRIPGNEQDMSICLIVMDDGSTDFTRELCEKFANEQLPIYYFYMGDKQPGQWRDSAAFINQGMSFALHALNASFVFPTHPEICVGEDTIATIVDYCKETPDAFGMAKGYYLTPEQQVKYGWDWDSNKLNVSVASKIDEILFWDLHGIDGFIERLNNLNQNFYNYGDPNHDYHHLQVEKAKVWNSWIFCGARRETWLKFGGLSESPVWGTVDTTFLSRRYHGGFITWTPDSRESMVVHQCHDEGLPTDTPRNMELCMETAAKLDATPCQPELLNPNRWKA